MELAAAKIPGAISLAQGIPSFSTPQVVRDFVCERIQEGRVDKYSLTLGMQELREEIAHSLRADGLEVDPDAEIIITVGSIEGISATLLALISPGDEVLIPSPSYASYRGVIQLARGIPKYFPLDEEHNFDFDVEQVEKAITAKTKAILYTNPNNPTGTLYSKEKTIQLAALALKHGITLIMDEVYKDFYYTTEEHFSACTIKDLRTSCVRICSFSKAFAMTGWRVGFLHADKSLVSTILKYHDALVTCAPVVSQYGALAALRYGAPYLKQFIAQFKQRRDYTLERLDKLTSVLDIQIPQATYFAFPRIKGSVPLALDSHALAYDILNKVGVALVPGVAFGPTGEQHLRINFGREQEDLTRAFDRLSDYFLTPQKTAGSVITVKKPLPVSRSFITSTLSFLARTKLNRSKNPIVIAIAGNKGKTEFKRTIAALLEQLGYKVRTSILGYNTGTGLPLSILGVEKAPGVPLINIACKLLASSITPSSEEILILEYGIKSPEDAKSLCAVTTPDWLVVTGTDAVEPSHHESRMVEGIVHLTQMLPGNRILWNKFGAQLPSTVHPRIYDPSLVKTDNSASTYLFENQSIALKHEKVGDSSRAAIAAAVALGMEIKGDRELIIRSLSSL